VPAGIGAVNRHRQWGQSSCCHGVFHSEHFWV